MSDIVLLISAIALMALVGGLWGLLLRIENIERHLSEIIDARKESPDA